jgi:arsenite methyltransferase
MTPTYLSYTFTDDKEFISTFDEAPLWSASFGLLLLKHLKLKPHQTVVDIGSGAGFPLLELAGRCGSTCKIYGIDPWKNANERAAQKIKNYGYSNVEIIEASAEKIPFDDNSVDLIVSNLGINNFENPSAVFKECGRILKPTCKLALTTNLSGHWKEFYEIFYTTLKQIGKNNLIAILKKDEAHRGTMETVCKLFTDNGFKVTRHVEEILEMKFVDGSAFLNHHSVKIGWLTTWMGLFPKEDLREIFTAVEHNLNAHATAKGELTLTVPMAFVEGEKIQ